MGLPTRFHGDPKLDDPNLIKGMCSSCNQIREWKIEIQSDGGSIKTCKTCGMRVHAKAPKPEPPQEVQQGKRDIKDEVIGLIQKVISQIGNAIK